MILLNAQDSKNCHKKQLNISKGWHAYLNFSKARYKTMLILTVAIQYVI